MCWHLLSVTCIDWRCSLLDLLQIDSIIIRCLIVLRSHNSVLNFSLRNALSRHVLQLTWRLRVNANFLFIRSLFLFYHDRCRHIVFLINRIILLCEVNASLSLFSLEQLFLAVKTSSWDTWNGVALHLWIILVNNKIILMIHSWLPRHFNIIWLSLVCWLDNFVDLSGLSLYRPLRIIRNR